MPLAYPDTSFLYSLYGDDRYSASATHTMSESSHQLLVSELGRLEYLNALMLAGFRKLVTPAEIKQRKSAFLADLESGLLLFREAVSSALFSAAQELVDAHNYRGGHRTVDFLHVAVASQLKAGHFYSFDARQRDLATKAGFTVNEVLKP